MEDINLIHCPNEKEPYIIVFKSKGLPSAPLKEGEKSLVTYVLNLFPECKNVKGKKIIEYGLVHRLDTQTSGLIMMAETQEFYDAITKVQKEGHFFKTYHAFCHKNSSFVNSENGFPPFEMKKEKLNEWSEGKLTNDNFSTDSFLVESFFRPYGKENSLVRPVTEKSGLKARKKSGEKLYQTLISLKNTDDKEKYEAVCVLKNGFRHQVRCHLAWAGFPIIGDTKYNPRFAEKNKDLRFEAVALDFINPIDGKEKHYSLDF